MRAVVVTHSSTYETRAEAAGDFFRNKGYEVTWIFSDFDHLRKKTLKREHPQHVYLHMNPYASNLSVRRILSIRDFSLAVEKYLEDLFTAGCGPDLLYILIPANSLAAAAGRLHAKYGVRIVFDLLDLWPESLPLKKIEVFPPLAAWRNLRDRNLGAADMIFTECSLYRKELSLDPEKSRTLYWFKREATDATPDQPGTAAGGGSDERKKTSIVELSATETKGSPNEKADSGMAKETSRKRMRGTLHIVYMGAVNHIIDIDGIVRILQAVMAQRPVYLHVIGEGDGKQDFLRALCQAGIPFTDYGAVYDEQKKAAILSECRFGLNVMKKSVHVGLTMKSIDYLSFGLPLINTIGGDTWDIIEKHGIGVNVDPEDIRAGAAAICRLADQDRRELAAAARSVFEENFTERAFMRTMEESLLFLHEL